MRITMKHVRCPPSSRAPLHPSPSYTLRPWSITTPPSSSNQKNNQVSQTLPSLIMAQNPELQHNLPYQLAKVSTALTFGGSVSVLSGLTLTATIIGLTAMTPLLVIFSPVLVAAGVVMVLLAAGLLSSAVFAAMAAFVFYWLHSYLAGKHPVGADMLDQVAAKLASGASRIKDRATQSGQHLLKQSQHDAY